LEYRHLGSTGRLTFPPWSSLITALLALDQYLARRWAMLVLQSAPSVVQRLMELIPLRAVRLEEAP
jgi:hypothetical protein